MTQDISLDPAQYDPIATAYQEYADTNAYNALCERPCTLSLLPPVTGQSDKWLPQPPEAQCEYLGKSSVPVDETILRRVIREELQRARGLDSSPHASEC